MSDSAVFVWCSIMSATRRSSRKPPSDFHRSCLLANDIIDLIRQPRDGVTLRHAASAAYMALRQVWLAGGGTDLGLLATLAAAVDDAPAVYYGPRSRLVH